jgi:hypothetical protein
MDGIIQLLTPDLIKIKANFLPIITIDPKKESIISKIFQPKIYLIKGDFILKVDPQTKKITQATPEELKQQGMNIIDIMIFSFVFVSVTFGMYKLLDYLRRRAH